MIYSGSKRVHRKVKVTTIHCLMKNFVTFEFNIAKDETLFTYIKLFRIIKKYASILL